MTKNTVHFVHLLSVPTLRTLRNLFPDCEIHTGEAYGPGIERLTHFCHLKGIAIDQ